METKELVKLALAEDVGAGDVTTRALVPEGRRYKAAAVAKASGVLCGTEPALLAFRLVDPDVRIALNRRDGDRLAPGDIILEAEGGRGLLTAERVALNFLQHLSGVATQTALYVEAVKGTPAVILDTRKTVPGLRALEKHAVKCGGGVCHRMGLYDAVLVKDNHIRAAGWDRIRSAVTELRAGSGIDFIEIEAQSLEEVRLAASANPDIILLDNFTLPDIKKAVRLIHALPQATRPQIEISGGVNLKTVRALAEAGAERISVGRITHSAPALDISLEIYEDQLPQL